MQNTTQSRSIQARPGGKNVVLWYFCILILYRVAFLGGKRRRVGIFSDYRGSFGGRKEIKTNLLARIDKLKKDCIQIWRNSLGVSRDSKRFVGFLWKMSMYFATCTIFIQNFSLFDRKRKFVLSEWFFLKRLLLWTLVTRMTILKGASDI